MIKDSEIVTKKYLKSQLAPIYREFDVLRSEINNEFSKVRSEMKQQKIEIVEELRAEIHQSIQSAMQNMQASHERDIKRYVGAVIEGMREENRAIRDGIKMLIEKTDNHEIRLKAAGI